SDNFRRRHISRSRLPLLRFETCASRYELRHRDVKEKNCHLFSGSEFGRSGSDQLAQLAKLARSHLALNRFGSLVQTVRNKTTRALQELSIFVAEGVRLFA